MDRLIMYLNVANTIHYGISGVLVGTTIDEYYDHDYKGFKIRVENRGDGSGVVHITKGVSEWSLVFRKDSKYPDLIDGNDATSELEEGFVKDGRLIASSLSPYITDMKKLGNPLIDVSDIQDNGVIDLIVKTLGSKGVFSHYDPEQRAIRITQVTNKDIDISELRDYIGRMYYPTTRSDTVLSNRKSTPIKQSSMDLLTENDQPLGSVRAVEIMSNTPTYLNKDLLDSLPDVDKGTTEVTNQVINSKYMTPKAFKRIKDAYSNGSVEELLSNTELIEAWKRHDYKKIKEELGVMSVDELKSVYGYSDEYLKKHGLSNGETISGNLYALYGIRTNDLHNILKVEDNPITTDNGQKTYNIFERPEVKDISYAKLVTDEYIKENDINKAVYSMFTSRGERMYADGDNNYQSNTIIRENLRFAPVDASNIDKENYEKNLLQTIGGSLAEDGYYGSNNIKYSKSELEDIAKKFISYGYDESDLTPRLKSQLRAYNNLDNFGVVDTGLSTTLDATFSGLAVNSAITGKTNNVGMINIKDENDMSEDSMQDLYSNLGTNLIDELKKMDIPGVDNKKARKLVKPLVMTAMYNSSENRRIELFTKNMKEELKEVYSGEELNEKLKELKPYIKETAKNATDVLSTTIKENDVMNLVDKGIVEVFRSDRGVPEPFDPEDIDDLVSNTAGIRINKPDGTHTTIMNDSSSLDFVDGILVASKSDHVQPFVDTTSVKDGVLVNSVKDKKFLDNISTAIARSYDSYVASYVVEKLHDEDIPVVTTHDAFTVPVYASDRTRELYNEAINNLYEFGGSDKRVNARNNLSTE